MLTVFVSCSKDDDSGSNSIKKATVKGAQLIYKNSITTRATTAEEIERFMTIDNHGNVKPIRFITERGDTLDMSIEKVENLNKDYLILNGTFLVNDVSVRSLLVNKNTEAIYIMKDREDIYSDIVYPSFEDKYNYLYIGDYKMVYRFNVSNPDNVTLENYIPETQQIYSYFVNKSGFCYYHNNSGNKNIKCPGGRIYSILELIPKGINNIFSGFDNKFYVISDVFNDDNGFQYIYRLDEIGNNELKVIELSTLTNDERGHHYSFCPNHKRKTYIASNGHETLEFNEETGEITKLNLNIPIIYYSDYNDNFIKNTFVTSESLWIFNENKLYQLSLNDYSLKIINLINEGYEINQENITCSIESPGLSFSGVRYSDGQNVVGTINEDGSITAFEKTKSGNPVITLLRLN